MSADPDPDAVHPRQGTTKRNPSGGDGAPFAGDRVERRRGSRVRAVLPIAFRLLQTGSSDVLAGHTREFSEGGMSIKIARPLPVGTRFLIYLSPGPPDGEALSLVYRVTRCVPDGETDADSFVAAATLIGRATALPQAAPPLKPKEILRRLRIDDPPRK